MRSTGKTLMGVFKQEESWSFHGVVCSKAQADKWRQKLAAGLCPWCGRAVAKRYSNQGKHLKACPDGKALKQMQALADDMIASRGIH